MKPEVWKPCRMARAVGSLELESCSESWTTGCKKALKSMRGISRLS